MNDMMTIDRLAYGGAGVGRVDGKTCFVPFTAPGDRAEISITREKPSYCEGRLQRLVEASPSRVPAPCPVFGDCGGCSWQHLDYQAQLEAKRAIVADQLWRFGRIDPACVEGIVPAPEPYGYRSRVQFKVRSTTDGVQIGFYRSGTHFVVAAPGCCRIASPAINRVLPLLAPIIASLRDPDKVPQLDVSVGEKGGVILIVHYQGNDIDSLRIRLLQMQEDSGITGMFIQAGRKETATRVFGDERLFYGIGIDDAAADDLELSFSKGGFSQVNYRQNRNLVRSAQEWAELTGTEQVLDLFCGNGNFTLPLARRSRRVLGIEGYAPSLEDARFNAARLQAGNVEFRCGDAATFTGDLAATGDRFDLVLLDPPRTGAKELMGTIADLAPQRVLYVSCDPATLARDAGILAARGYRVVACRIHDMFPQTYHIESITLLVR